MQDFKRPLVGGQFVRKLFLLISLAAITVGCSTLNEGSTDYRRAGSDATLVLKYGAEPQSSGPQSSSQVAKIIRKDETFYISLNQAFIRGFSESFDVQSLGYGQRVGEIAIIVQAQEITSETDFSFGAKTSDRKGRVVFFSNDVRQGQFLNLSFMPILGPKPYGGGPVLLDIYIVEVDTAANDQYATILSSLATLGKNTVFSTASPVLDILETIGTKLLAGRESDDIEMHYSAVFLPGDENAALQNYPRLEAGDYAFVRLHDRRDDLARGALDFDNNTGRLVNRTKPGTTEPIHCRPLDRRVQPSKLNDSAANEPLQYLYDAAPVRDDDCMFRGASYLTIQINKGQFGPAVELKSQTLKELIESLKAGNLDTKATSDKVLEILKGSKAANEQAALSRSFYKVLDAPRTPTPDAKSMRYVAADALLSRLKSAKRKGSEPSPDLEALETSVRSEMENYAADVAGTFSLESLHTTARSSGTWQKWVIALSAERPAQP